MEIGALESGERDHQAIVEGLVTALRPSVLRFARVMEGRLRHDPKKGWQHKTPHWLIDMAREEVRELDDAVDAVRARGVGDGRDEGVW